MSEPQALLNEVWNRYRRTGVADDLAIIGHIADVLTADGAPSGNPVPSQVGNLSAGDAEFVRDTLAQATTAAGSKAALFDRHVLFRLSAILPGGRYPTPRHIVRLVYTLLDVRNDHRIADFACGSGGFLVRRPKSKRVKKIGATVGCDISPHWTKIAQANMRLHGLDETGIETGNSLALYGQDRPRETNEQFDRVLMNPPFGASVDPELSGRGSGVRVRSRSETALTALALRQLKRGGRAGLLVPSGLLYGTGAAEYEIRKQCVDEYTLDAVVALPKDSFQPFSTLRTFLLLVHKQPATADMRCWLFQLERDGYPPGRARDLTEDPQRQSDFDYVPSVFVNSVASEETSLPKKSPVARVRNLRTQSGELSGFAVFSLGDAVVATVENYSGRKADPFYLIGLSDASAQTQSWFQLDQQSGAAKVTSDRDEVLRRRYGSSKAAIPDSVVLLSGSSDARGVVLTTDGRLLGVLVPQATIKANDYDLQFSRYARPPEEARLGEVERPQTILDSLRAKQREIAVVIDSLRGKLTAPAISTQRVPPAALGTNGTAISRDKLSPSQLRVFDWVVARLQTTAHDRGAYSAADYFNLSEIESALADLPSNVIRSTLGLLERMGQVVSVVISIPNSSQAVSAFRLATERDVWTSSTTGGDQEPEA